MRHIFIVTYGRTGSTLLLGVLNAVPGVRIFGENCGLYYYLYGGARAGERTRAHLKGEADTPTHAFHGASRLDVERLRRGVQGLCRDTLHRLADPATTAVTGFKEIRYDIPDIDDYLAFLAETFDDTRFVFLQRDVAATVKSGFWAERDAGAATARISFMRDRFAAYRDAHPDQAVVVDYDDIKAPGEPLQRLFGFLGLAYDPGALAPVFAERHSSATLVTKFFDGCRFVAADRTETARHFEMIYIMNGERMMPSEEIQVTGLAVQVLGRAPPSALFAMPYGEAPAPERAIATARSGLVSPGTAKRYPDHPGSDRARFKIVLPSAVGTATIFAAFDDEFAKLGDVFLDSGITQTFV